jgi:hypothetical protein
MEPERVIWTGELLWPTELPAGRIIDCSGLTALGTWAYGWLRARPQQILLAGPAGIRRQLQQAGVPVVWYERERDLPAAVAPIAGVGPGERALLWDDRDG